MSTLVKAQCLCGTNKYHLSYPTSSLPIPTSICNCNTCRHATGQSFAIYVDLDGPPLSFSSIETSSTGETQPAVANLDEGNLTTYASSEGGKRYFCSTCGAHMFFSVENSKDGKVRWEVCAGVLEKFDGIVMIDKHIFLGDTLDGGASKHITRYAGNTLPRYKGLRNSGETLPEDWNLAADSTGAKPQQPDTTRLHFHCLCKSISFHIKRPTKITNPSEEWWFVPGKTPSDPIRYSTEYCFCTSCRLSSGCVVTTWTYVPFDCTLISSECPSEHNKLEVKHIHPADPKTRPPALKQFKSSTNVRREFCGTCGATVFYWRDVEGEQKMDIATGLVDQDQAGGARAESWLAWVDGVSYEEDALSLELLKSVVEGVKRT